MCCISRKSSFLSFYLYLFASRELSKSIDILNRPTIMYTGNFANYQGLKNLLLAAVLVEKEMPDAVFLLIGGTKTCA